AGEGPLRAALLFTRWSVGHGRCEDGGVPEVPAAQVRIGLGDLAGTVLVHGGAGSSIPLVGPDRIGGMISGRHGRVIADELIRQVVGAGAVWIAGGRTGPDRAEAETVISRDRRVGVLGDGARSKGLPRGGEIGPGLPGRGVGGRHAR